MDFAGHMPLAAEYWTQGRQRCAILATFFRAIDGWGRARGWGVLEGVGAEGGGRELGHCRAIRVTAGVRARVC